MQIKSIANHYSKKKKTLIVKIWLPLKHFQVKVNMVIQKDERSKEDQAPTFHKTYPRHSLRLYNILLKSRNEYPITYEVIICRENIRNHWRHKILQNNWVAYLVIWSNHKKNLFELLTFSSTSLFISRKIKFEYHDPTRLLQ